MIVDRAFGVISVVDAASCLIITRIIVIDPYLFT
jgi:hypothetical protein